MTENKTTEKDETPRAGAPTVADTLNPGEPAEEAIELDDQQVQAISGGTTTKMDGTKM
jgi:hypothetical protein